MKCQIVETENFSLEKLWNASRMIARNTTVATSSRCTLLPKMNAYIINKANINQRKFNDIMSECRKELINQCKVEMQYWKSEIQRIKSYSHEQAIDELINAMKLQQKIDTINQYIARLQKGEQYEQS